MYATDRGKAVASSLMTMADSLILISFNEVKRVIPGYVTHKISTLAS